MRLREGVVGAVALPASPASGSSGAQCWRSKSSSSSSDLARHQHRSISWRVDDVHAHTSLHVANDEVEATDAVVELRREDDSETSNISTALAPAEIGG